MYFLHVENVERVTEEHRESTWWSDQGIQGFRVRDASRVEIHAKRVFTLYVTVA